MRKSTLTNTMNLLLVLCAIAGFTLCVKAQSINNEICQGYEKMQYGMFTPEYHIYYGCGYYANQDYQAAASNFETGVKQFPASASLYYHLGSAYAAFASMNKNEAQRETFKAKALAAFKKAYELDPGLKQKM